MTVIIIMVAASLLMTVFACCKVASDCSRQEEAGSVDEIYTVPKEEEQDGK